MNDIQHESAYFSTFGRPDSRRHFDPRGITFVIHRVDLFRDTDSHCLGILVCCDVDPNILIVGDTTKIADLEHAQQKDELTEHDYTVSDSTSFECQ